VAGCMDCLLGYHALIDDPLHGNYRCSALSYPQRKMQRLSL
jgi:hypothetical protein